jgi:ATP-binding cassette, subfamily B, bacterial
MASPPTRPFTWRPRRRSERPDLPRGSHWLLLADVLRPHRRRVAVLGTVLAGASVLPLVGPQLLRAFIDAAVADAGLARLAGIAGVYVVLGLIAQGAAVATAYTASRLAWTATNELRERAAAHTLHLDLAFHRDTTPGALIERVDGDATAIATFFTDVAVKVLKGGLVLCGVLVLVTAVDWRVGAGLAVFTAVVTAVVLRLRDYAVPASTEARASYARVIGVAEERLAGADDLRALGAGDHAVERLVEASAVNLHDSRRSELRSAALWSATTGLFALGAVGMLLGGWALHRAGAITLGTVFMLFQYTHVLRHPVEEIGQQLKEVQRAAAGAARIADLLATPSRLPAGGARPLPAGPLEVRVEGVGFSYPDDGVAVLRDVDLVVPAGQTVGLVGRTGSGKTTLARLALRLADPTTGRITVGGLDLRDADPARLRDRLAIVTQDVQLFRGTVRENLTLFGAVPATDDEVAGVLAEVGLGSWLDGLDERLETAIGPGGIGLSAGQAQLLGFARVFLRDPGLVVLDEASSRVDPATQLLVEAATERLLRDRTGIIIAHRLSSVLRTDSVAVLDHGRLVEHGPTASLAADPDSHLGRMLALEEPTEVTA